MTLGEITALVAAVSAALGVIYSIARLLFQRFPPKAVGVAAELKTIRDDLAETRSDLRLLTDYVHDLREDFAKETGKAPRDWPEGLRL